MSLIDRYIAEVGRHLPEKDRADIEAEIRSMLEDMLEERSRRMGSPVDHWLIAEVLEELGDPRLLASRYAPARRYLIGPGWYEVYLQTLQRILVLVLPIFAAVTFILTLTEEPLGFLNAIGKAFGGAFNVGVQIWFWMTLVFVFMERAEAIPGESLTPTSRAWTVAQLPELPHKRQISIGETMMNIAMILFVMMWIVLPALQDRFQSNDGTVPFLHPNLWSFWLPTLLIILGFTLVHAVFQLKVGNWTPALTITNVILGLLSIVYIAALVLTQDVINPAFLAMLGKNAETARLREVVRWSIDISAAIVAGIYVWDMVHSIRMARQLEKNNNMSTQTGSKEGE